MFLAFVFWIGCKWIKKGGLCAWGWENREPFFIDLLRGKQVLLKVGKTTCAVGSVGLGGFNYFSDSVPISKKNCVYLKGLRFRAMYSLASFSMSCLVLTLFAYIHSSISSFLKNSFLPNL